jgi:hypothetical protein
MNKEMARDLLERLLDVEDRPLREILAALVEELEPPLYVVKLTQGDWQGSTLLVHQDGVELLSVSRREQGVTLFKRRSLAPLHGLSLEERAGFQRMYTDRESWFDGATVMHPLVGTFEVGHSRGDDDEALKALIKMLRGWSREPFSPGVGGQHPTDALP